MIGRTGRGKPISITFDWETFEMVQARARQRGVGLATVFRDLIDDGIALGSLDILHQAAKQLAITKALPANTTEEA